MKRILQGSLWFLLARLVALLSLSWEGLVAHNDLLFFYRLAALPGWPFVHYWAEYPPLFSWLIQALYRLMPSQPGFVYLLAFLISVAQGVSLGLLWALAEEGFPDEAPRRALAYGMLTTVGLLYAWGCYDPLVVAFTLGEVYLWRREHLWGAGTLLGLGILSKWFPALVFPAWFRRRGSAALRALVPAVGLTLIVWGLAYAMAPNMALASLMSQMSKGSWETVWALIDGNLHTGLFGPLPTRFDPQQATVTYGNPPRLSPWVTLLPFLALGWWAWRRIRPQQAAHEMAFIGLTSALFFLWVPGYSPQWMLYLLPWVFLSLPWPRALLFGLTLTLIHLMEWPLALSRGMFTALWWIIPLRTFLIALLGLAFWEAATAKSKEN
ncbi:MAG TPA: DUF2029 domain-containing protein [Anaerolineae bacterium]|nr:DUF2029 domain-containing protein [Anaerolineae bacterium]HID85037.1 DUF2029 domain-containing protein [Anaerolineales bacterium]HIQ08836.1 DUF2029 domain-containing protein [Anaerolineaceae bacterium]